MSSWIKNNRFIFRILIVKLILAFGVFALCPLEVDAGRVRVRGYYRKDGTYVRPHYRSAPDGNPYNNYSYPGNYNPNTGKITPGDPQKYLERYYNRSSSRTSSVDFDTWLKSLESRSSANRVKVGGYYRKDGTYVRPHYRTAPDGNPYNNYSYPGNYNPNTGKITPGNPVKSLEEVEERNPLSYTDPSLDGDAFTSGSTLREVAAIQGTPDWFAETQYDYGDSRVYFENGRVTHWYNTPLNPLRTRLTATSANKGFVTVGSTTQEVVAIQGSPDWFTETQYSYGRSSIYFTRGRVTHWHTYVLDPLRVKLAAPPTDKTHFTVGSTQEEVVVIQGTPTSLTETRYDYGRSSIYFAGGRVTRWNSSPLNPLKAELTAPPTDKTHFMVDSTKDEVAAIQGTPTSFTKTRYDYGRSSVYFEGDRVTHWNNSSQDPLKVKLASTPWNNSSQDPLKVKLASMSAGRTHFTVGSTKEEVTSIQGTPTSFSETHFSYGASVVYFKGDRVTRWYNSSLNPLKVKLASTSTGKSYFTVGSTHEEVIAIQGTPTTFTETRFTYGHSVIYFENDQVTHWENSPPNPLKVK